jgi:hypothetical protein
MAFGNRTVFRGRRGRSPASEQPPAPPCPTDLSLLQAIIYFAGIPTKQCFPPLFSTKSHSFKSNLANQGGGKTMNETIERTSAVKQRKRAATLSPAEQELKEMKAYITKITSSKADSLDFLQRAGIVTKKGALTKHYRA